MSIFMFIVFFFIGFYLFSYVTIQALLTLTCGIPCTVKLSRAHALKDRKPYVKIIITILVSLFITVAVAIPTFIFASNTSITGFLVGIGFAFFCSLPDLGSTEKNVADWLDSIGNSLVPFDKL